MLGTLKVILNDITIDAWPSGRARSVFSFLLSQYHHLVPRDVIMDTFWPEASPESARNSLNVAIYSLRHTLKTAFDQPVVLFHDNIYQINPDLSVWLDIDSFEKHIQAAHSAETAGQVNSAVHQYEVALNLYQGNFLEDNLYEEWPVIERERLRVLNMDALEHLSLIYLNQNQYASCETLCRRMLAFDSCREDAHCRLMRCYSRQGQQHLALRQYLACVDALHNDLDVSPSPTTAQLYEQIRRREPV
jgi:DNA-binding SARP family transcriptional activator